MSRPRPSHLPNPKDRCSDLRPGSAALAMLILAPLLLALACGEPVAPTPDPTPSVSDPGAAAVTAPVPAPQTGPSTTAEPRAAASPARDDEASTPPAPAADAVHMDRGLVVGTWAADGELGFDEQWVDEAGLREVFTKDRARRREWRGFSTADEKVPMEALTGDRTGDVVAYAYTVVERNRPDATWPDQDAVLHLTYRGRVQVRYDGKLVIDAPAPPEGSVAVQRVPVQLTDAFDTILVKVGRGPSLGTSLDVGLRLSAPDGSRLEFTRFWPMRIPGLPREIPVRER